MNSSNNVHNLVCVCSAGREATTHLSAYSKYSHIEISIHLLAQYVLGLTIFNAGIQVNLP